MERNERKGQVKEDLQDSLTDLEYRVPKRMGQNPLLIISTGIIKKKEYTWMYFRENPFLVQWTNMTLKPAGPVLQNRSILKISRKKGT